ncbi:FixH family protein [Cytobacillus gottheilii]|uniref:FixH family protein n=1 Tax=Cytobacillus gottheilii TaxID=859144 RepID=UPI0009BC07C4|nr:FixH family protein [Cytobacillus gottheilii]
MKRLFSVFIFSAFLLSACSLDENVADLYKQESPLEADILIPEYFSKEESELIQVQLTQNGKIVENPDFVHLEIWKQDGSLNYGMEEAENLGDGIFGLSKPFDLDGLYYVKVHASSAGSMIVPTKQFIVGELSQSDLDALQKGIKQEGDTGGHHH